MKFPLAYLFIFICTVSCSDLSNPSQAKLQGDDPWDSFGTPSGFSSSGNGDLYPGGANTLCSDYIDPTLGINRWYATNFFSISGAPVFCNGQKLPAFRLQLKSMINSSQVDKVTLYAIDPATCLETTVADDVSWATLVFKGNTNAAAGMIWQNQKIYLQNIEFFERITDDYRPMPNNAFSIIRFYTLGTMDVIIRRTGEVTYAAQIIYQQNCLQKKLLEFSIHPQGDGWAGNGFSLVPSPTGNGFKVNYIDRQSIPGEVDGLRPLFP